MRQSKDSGQFADEHNSDGRGQFRPLPNERPCARLVQITDPHLLRDPLDTHRGVNTSTSLESVVSHAQAFIQDADAVLLTGDIAQDEETATYSRLRETWTNQWIGVQPEVWCVPGNHDAPVLMCSELNDAPFSCLGHHALGNWEVIMLDTRNPGKASGLLGTQELERLSSRLTATSAAHILIGLHHHPVPLRQSWLDKVGLEDRDALEHIVTNDPRVRAVLFGHIHQAVDRTENGIRYLGCPSTGVQFIPNQTEFGIDDRPPGFRSLILYPSGGIRTHVFWVPDAQPNIVANTTDGEHS